MRARFAYISSLGTTAILVAAALLMLAVVSAIVAFRGWPGQASSGGVQTIPLAPGDATQRGPLVRHPPTPGDPRGGAPPPPPPPPAGGPGAQPAPPARAPAPPLRLDGRAREVEV